MAHLAAAVVPVEILSGLSGFCGIALAHDLFPVVAALLLGQLLLPVVVVAAILVVENAVLHAGTEIAVAAVFVAGHARVVFGHDGFADVIAVNILGMPQFAADLFFRFAFFGTEAELFFAVFDDAFQVIFIALAEIIAQEVHKFILSHSLRCQALPFR